MIEVIEHATPAGTHAGVVGGKTRVTITPAPAQTWPGHYTNSIKMSRPNYWTAPVTIPAGWVVCYGGRSTRTTTYQRAVALAVHHAKRS